MSYDDANSSTRREVSLPNVVGVASATMVRHLQFQKARLKKVHALVNVAGTNAAAGVDIFIGTTSVGAVTVGTNTAGSTASSALIDSDIPALGMVEIKGKANSATMNVSLILEEQVLPDATQS